MSRNSNRMTGALFQNVKCHLCLEEFDDPRLLDCFHSFCRHCLEEYLETFQERYIECPLCDKETARPQKAKDLKKNIYLQIHRTKIGVSCSVCGEAEVARSHCMECEQDFCSGCIKSHGGISATREHHLIKVNEDNHFEKVSRELYCKIHEEETLSYFCVDCEKPICKHCNLTLHKHHTSKHTSEVASALRHNLETKSESKEHKHYLMWLEEKTEEFADEIDRCRKLEKKTIKEITDRAEDVIAIVKEIREILIQKTSSMLMKRKQPLKEKVSVFQKFLRSFSEVLLHSRNLYKQADNLEIVYFSKDIAKALDDLKQQKDSEDVVIGDNPIFKPAKAETDQLLPYFGDVLLNNEMPLGATKKLFDFVTNKNETIMSMIPLTDQRTWVIGGEGAFTLYDTTGRIHRKLKLGINADDVYATNDKIIISGNSSKSVVVFDQKLKKLASIEMDLCVRGLVVYPEDNSIYTCLTEKNAFYDHDPTHLNRIVRIVPKDRNYDKSDVLVFSGTPTVEYPARLAITKTGRIAVSDWKRNCLILLNKSGYIESEHFHAGGSDISHKMYPRGICTDKDGNVYIADYYNNRILLFEEQTGAMKVFLSGKDGVEEPWSMAVGQDGLMWVGSKAGKICVFNIKTQNRN